MEALSMVAQPLLSATFDWMLQKLDGFISSNSQGLQEEVHANLRKWRTLLPQIRGLLRDAEEKQLYENFVKIWLDDLNDLAYDMEDIFEELKAGIDVQWSSLIAEPQQATSSKFIPTTCFSCFKGNNFMFDSQTISKVKDISERLNNLVDQSITLGLASLRAQAGERPNRVDAIRITTSLPDPYVCGRESDKSDILREVLADRGSDKGYSVIPIVGMGGVGKTTLARCIYNEVGGSFYPKVWVCVSDQFNILSITGSILKAVSNDQCDLKDLNLLQERLREKLSYKKFLLVLDDVWNEGSVPWDTLQKPFQLGSAGSKIIVTTRNENVVKTMDRKAKIHRLKLLEFEQCLPILAQQALGEKNFGAHPNLKEVGEEIVKKCNGLPLVARVTGGLLQRSLDREYWKYINNKMLNLQAQESGILPVLMLSYHDLPFYLKQCFAYCALFPKDYPFKKDELVMLWMAEGLLWQKPGDQNILEEIGHQYFCELLSRSFFEQSSGNELEYVMHDLIHDLAQFVAGRTCHNLQNMLEVDKKSEVKIEKVRHLSFHCSFFDVSEKFEVLNEMKSLRTLIVANPKARGCFLAKTVVLDWIPKLRSLRALSLKGYHIRKLPDSIRDLKCLKYLDLSETRIQSLPESIVFLLQLQTLLLFNCKSFSKFPVKIGNLINLHHLDIRGTDSLKEMPSRIANLKDLLTLSKFIVGKENGSIKLSDLENLSQLKGELSILDLHNVLDVHDARKASLDKIDGLDWLLLQWTSEVGSSRNEDREMELCKCRRSTSLPSLGQLPALKELIVEGMDAIETVDYMFYGHGTFQSLEKLEFRDMLVWEEWTSTTGGGVGFSCLRELVIENCSKLIGQLPSQLSCVINLVIRRCPKLRCPSSMGLQSLQKLNIEDCNVAFLNSLADLISLTSLEIKRISGLVCLARSFIESLIAVEKVEIKECLELTCLWEEGAEIENLARLEKMNIESCPLLVSLTGKEHGLLPFNLKHLTLSSCKALESLTDAMMMKVDGSSSSNNMLRLDSLSIYNCESLKSLPTTMVKHLTINGCVNFESLPDGVLLQDDGDSNSNLEYLRIERLPSLNSVGSGHLPASLQEFTVEDCKRLESFPERMLQHCTGLESIRIGDCEVLRSLSLDGLSNLRDLNIRRCAVLEFFLEMGLSLPNLRSLTIIGCRGLERILDGGFPPNLTDLKLDGEHLKQPAVERGLRNLTSLQSFGIYNTCPPPGIVLPPSLIYVVIANAKNLKSIPRGLLQNLNSLEYLGIYCCPKLRSLPREGLPPSLGYLWIYECPLLKRQRFEEKGEYLSLTRTIPLVQIDDDEVKTYTQTHTLM
ncbi:hypothetical protein SLEP1_g52327 [Rubroshorea leprosula]|uniref:Disease resistance RPP13-like protein 1 n=1 Tax=Rubroshorea leprosula TaxID=152421 RepID=A0AAV5M887_9ROSI|nr:hypothetical protein SLEP1_g52327 [Rubroshorea leprosula]